MFWIALPLLLAAGTPGEAPEVGTGGVEGRTPADPAERLDAAIRTYLVGDLDQARERLLVLAADPTIEDEELRERIRLYLGAVEVLLGEEEAAHDIFVALLLEDPDLTLDPFEHPPDVQYAFERARATARRTLEEARSAPPKPLPLLLEVVPGVEWMRQDRVAGGLAVLGGVTALGVASVGLRSVLLQMDRNPDLAGIQVHTDWDLERARALRTANQVTGWTCVGAWGAAVALNLAQRRRAASISLSVAPGGLQATLRR